MYVFGVFCYLARAIMGVGARCSCKELFKKIDILSIPCEYIFSLLMFVTKNFDDFLTNTA